MNARTETRLGLVARATRADAADVVALRLACYRAAREFELLQPQCLEWTAVDEASVVYRALGEGGRLLATVRSGWVASAEALAERMGCDCTLPPACFPTLLLGRGATAPDAARQGLHSLLRWHFLQAASALGARSVTGSVYEHAPRVRTMGELGYRFERPQQVWDPEVRPIQAMLVAWMPASDFEAARHRLAEVLGPALDAYPIDFDAAAAHGPAPAQR